MSDEPEIRVFSPTAAEREAMAAIIAERIQVDRRASAVVVEAAARLGVDAKRLVFNTDTGRWVEVKAEKPEEPKKA